MTGKSVPQILEEIGTLLEIKGENPFKSRAYYNAAKTLSGIDNLDEIITKRKLKEIKGIGEAMPARLRNMLPRARWPILRN
jgi:DNA polymerase (family 10)